MRERLGLFDRQVTDRQLIDELFDLLDNFGFSYAFFMRSLVQLNDIGEDKFVERVVKYSIKFEHKLSRLSPKVNMTVFKNLTEIYKSSLLSRRQGEIKGVWC